MSTARDYSSMPEKASPARKELIKLQEKLDSYIVKMTKDESYKMEQSKIDNLAEHLMDIINKYHDHVVKWEGYLKTALIELTEIPTMQPEMQRIANITALKEASSNVKKFLELSSR